MAQDKALQRKPTYDQKFSVNNFGGDSEPDHEKERMRAQIKDAMKRYKGKIIKLTPQFKPARDLGGRNNPLVD